MLVLALGKRKLLVGDSLESTIMHIVCLGSLEVITSLGHGGTSYQDRPEHLEDVVLLTFSRFCPLVNVLASK